MRAKRSVAAAARSARGTLAASARPAGEFDASRYFRGDHQLGFLNVGTTTVRRLARQIHTDHRGDWSVADALVFADLLIRDRHLEVKALGIEVLARYRRDLTPALLPRWKRWLAAGYAGNWATTDAICGSLIGPTLVASPAAAARLESWSRHRVLWVRRASIVGLIPLARRGGALPLLYRIAKRLHADREDLIQKGVGWALREAGKTDPARLERYLRDRGRVIPRTTLRYAIERFPAATRRDLLSSTR